MNLIAINVDPKVFASNLKLSDWPILKNNYVES